MQELGVEITLKADSDFSKISETLTRIGIVSQTAHTITPSCYILHKGGKYYIVHFKEMFILDNLNSTVTPEDIKRRDCIAMLLDEWGLCSIVNKKLLVGNAKSAMPTFKVIPYSQKSDYTVVHKYTFGKNKK